MNAPRHEYSRFDRLTIDGIFYQPDGQNDEFVRLKRLDGSDVCSLFTYDDIDKLRGTSGWRLEKDWFAESASPVEAIKPPEFMTASLTPDEQEALTWLRLVFGAMDELRDSGQMSLTHEGVDGCRAQLEALVLKREIERSNLKAKPRGGTKVAVRVFPSTSTLLRKSGTRKSGSINIWSWFMNFSIVRTIRHLFVPQHELSCSWLVWRKLMASLRQRGANSSRESGAFLLGYKAGGQARIVDFVLYDDLDPLCLESGIVRFDGRYFSELWAICKARKLTVVADVHVHPGGEQQSKSDRAHPMISRSGHLALIVPNFAKRAKRSTVGIYRYLGNKDWESVPKSKRKSFFHVGF